MFEQVSKINTLSPSPFLKKTLLNGFLESRSGIRPSGARLYIHWKGNPINNGETYHFFEDEEARGQNLNLATTNTDRQWADRSPRPPQTSPPGYLRLLGTKAMRPTTERSQGKGKNMGLRIPKKTHVKISSHLN